MGQFCVAKDLHTRHRIHKTFVREQVHFRECSSFRVSCVSTYWSVSQASICFVQRFLWSLRSRTGIATRDEINVISLLGSTVATSLIKWSALHCRSPRTQMRLWMGRGWATHTVLGEVGLTRCKGKGVALILKGLARCQSWHWYCGWSVITEESATWKRHGSSLSWKWTGTHASDRCVLIYYSTEDVHLLDFQVHSRGLPRA